MTTINSASVAIDVISNSNDLALKYHAIWWLGKNRELKAVDVLCQVLNDDGDQAELGGFPLRRQAARSLGMIGDPKGFTSLVESLKSTDLRLQEAAILALRSINDPRSAESLIQYLESENSCKPMEALIEACAAFEIWDVADAIREYLTDTSKRIQGAAEVYFYRMTKDPKYLSTLTSNLADPNAFVRQSAAFDIAQCHDVGLSEQIAKANLPNNVKMAAIKQILEIYVGEKTSLASIPSTLDDVIIHLISTIDDLITDAIQGNLPSTNDIASQNQPEINPQQLAKRHLVNQLQQNTDGNEPLLKSLLEDETVDCAALCAACIDNEDQDVRAAIVQLLYFTKCTEAVAVLQHVIGLEIANHCQGKLRRVALLALGKLYHDVEEGSETRNSIQSTLQWALTEPEDWGLRYAAILAYECMASMQTINFELLSESNRSCQTDCIIGIRMAVAKSKIKGIDADLVTI